MSIITNKTDGNGDTYYSVIPEDDTNITLATAGTYVPANIKFIINGIIASVEDIDGSDSKRLVLEQASE